jgi:hypothetical protein
MGIESLDDLQAEIARLDIRDGPAVRALAQKLEALGDPAQAHELYCRSNALKRAVGSLRTDALFALLARDAREEFIQRTNDALYMAPVELEALRVPRYVAVQEHRCDCGAKLMVPFHKQGGPGFGFDCPACQAPYLARHAFTDGEYQIAIDVDTRPAKKRKKRPGVL